jgi:hypothetical protein
VSRCPFPDKEQLSRAEATRVARVLNRNPARGKVYAYRCPSGEHSHVGRRPDGARKKRKRR